MKRRAYRPERIWKWRGWTVSAEHVAHLPFELYMTWVDERTAYAAFNVGRSGCDPVFSIVSPDFHPRPGGVVAAVVTWTTDRYYDRW